MRLESCLFKIIKSVINNNLETENISWKKNKCMTVVLCSNGYPEKYNKDIEIKNLEKLVVNNKVQVFHAGTYEKSNKIFSNGGRVLNVTALADTLIETRNICIESLEKIAWNFGFFRKDIGWRSIKKNENNSRQVQK